jgi:hypothetical protein
MSLENGWRPDTPVGDSVLRRFLFNQADLGDLIAEAAEGRHARMPGVALADVGVPVPYLNQAVLLKPVLAADGPVLASIDEFFAPGSHPATILSAWPTPDLTSRGWVLVGHPMFVLRAPVPHMFRSNTGVAVRQAHTPEDLATAETVAVRGYPLPEAAGLPPNALFGAALLGGPLRIRVAAVEGTPAAIGSSHVAYGVVNLCLAATLPTARRRGAWESLVWARIDDGPGLPAAAFTSDDSRPGFVRMGFLPVTRFTLWLRP